MKKKEHKDESILDKAKDAVDKYAHKDTHKKKEDESFLDKAKDAMDKYTKH
ncbi:hypothetical protein PHMEG_00016859 [Phytophthora megakarya]|uniref:Uncharacterized protein n=1 Tax=Phytophthora megakarya TaxID=4795 RepID=A0A225VY72_9STRA|nr:hypothetical protein PHMEG_00016859 [Phytophthora megakarya]